MSRQKSIWVIEQGCYSDYHVVGVFSSKENAETIVAALNKDREWGDPATVEEWPLDPAVKDLNKGHFRYRVLMRRDGTVESVDQQEISAYHLAGQVTVWERSTAPAYAGKNIPDVLDATVWASSPKHAVKIANEKRTQMIATGEWS